VLSRFNKGEQDGSGPGEKVKALRNELGSLIDRMNLVEASLQKQDEGEKNALKEEVRQLRDAIGQVETSLGPVIELLDALKGKHLESEKGIKALNARFDELETRLKTYL